MLRQPRLGEFDFGMKGNTSQPSIYASLVILAALCKYKTYAKLPLIVSKNHTRTKT